MGRPSAYRTADGKRVPSVTTVLRNLSSGTEGLVRWAWQLGVDGIDLDEARQKAMNVGTVAHAMIEADIKGETLDVSALPPELVLKAKQAYDSWREWRASMHVEPIAAECSLVSEAYRYGGTFDLCAVMQHRTVLDWKVTSGIYPEQLVQLAAYAKLWEEHHPDEPIERICIVRLGKDEPLFDVILRSRGVIEKGWEVFTRLLQIHAAMPDLKRAA